MSNKDSLLSNVEQSNTRASAFKSPIRSLTVSVTPSAKTSWPWSRSANVRSCAISGVSSISRMRFGNALALAGAGQPRLLGRTGLQVQNPHAAAGGVVSALIVFEHRAPGFESAHGEGDSFEVVAQVAEDFVGVPIIGEDGIARMHFQHGVKAIVRSLVADFACRAALFAFRDDIALLPGCGRRRNVSGHRVLGVGCVGAHSVCATASASAAAAMLTWFFGSAALTKASGSCTPIICHCWLANFCKLAMCSACRCPNLPCSFKYSETGRIVCGRKL